MNSSTPVPNPSVVLREEFDDWAVLYNPDSATAVGVNPVGVAIWKLLDGARSIEAIAEDVAARFSAAAPETVRADTHAFVADLARQGFVGSGPERAA